MAQVILGYLIGAVDYLVEAASHILKSLCHAEAALHLVELSLRPLDSVTDSLAGNALILGYLGERKVIIIVVLQKITLLCRQHFTVEINKDSYFIILCHD